MVKGRIQTELQDRKGQQVDSQPIYIGIEAHKISIFKRSVQDKTQNHNIVRLGLTMISDHSGFEKVTFSANFKPVVALHPHQCRRVHFNQVKTEKLLMPHQLINKPVQDFKQEVRIEPVYFKSTKSNPLFPYDFHFQLMFHISYKYLITRRLYVIIHKAYSIKLIKLVFVLNNRLTGWQLEQ